LFCGSRSMPCPLNERWSMRASCPSSARRSKREGGVAAERRWLLSPRTPGQAERRRPRSCGTCKRPRRHCAGLQRRSGGLRPRARADTRAWMQDRRARTRRLIELGGLVQKSGLPQTFRCPSP
jgi:hypothetical protein